MYELPNYSDKVRTLAKESLLLCADWMIKNQKNDEWPCWTADRGRFLSQLTHKDDTTLGDNIQYTICWATGRTAQTLLSAYKISKDKKYLDAAEKGMEYVKSCQIFSPEFLEHRGACCEETGLSDHIAARDTIEAIQGFLNLYNITKNNVWKLRAEAGLDWLTGSYLDNDYYPAGYIWHRKGNKKTVVNDFSRIIMAAAPLIFAQYEKLTGNNKYSKFTSKFIDSVMDDCLKEDGSLMMNDGTDVGHHASHSGPLAGCFTNDDGFGITLIACYRLTGNEKYKKAAIANGEWWLRMKDLPETYASIPAALNFLQDMYRLTQDNRYMEKSNQYIESVLNLQNKNIDNVLLYGAFMGHESSMQKETDLMAGRDSIEFVSLRTSMYAVMALGKVAAKTEAEWNITYSGFGW